jgi:hypothetical protein
MRPTSEIALRRANDDKRRNTRFLSWHDIHHDAAGVDGATSRDVQAHPRHGKPALGDRPTGHNFGDDIHSMLVGMNFPGSLDRHFEGDAHRRIELIQGLGNDRGRNPQRLRSDTVEPFAGVEDSLGAPISDIIKGRLYEGSGVGQVHGGTRHLRAWIGGRFPHVDETEHGMKSTLAVWNRSCRSSR